MSIHVLHPVPDFGNILAAIKMDYITNKGSYKSKYMIKLLNCYSGVCLEESQLFGVAENLP